MIKKLNPCIEDEEEVRNTINEIIDILNKASNKPVNEQSIESWFNRNEERIIATLKNNPIPGEVYTMLRTSDDPDEVNLFLGLQDKNKKYIEMRCGVLIEKHGFENNKVLHGKPLSECAINKK